MTKLKDMCHTLRSKNAGPFQITFDAIFRSEEDFHRAEESGVFTPANLSKVLLYPGQDLRVVFYPAGKAIKVTVPRRASSGSFDDTDVFGCQQHAPLLDLEIP